MTSASPKYGIDADLVFHPLAVAVLTVSDTRDAKSDTSGELLAARAVAAGHVVALRHIVTDDIEAIRTILSVWIERSDIDVIVTTGGTGFSPRDVTPEAVRPLFKREMDGFSALFHQVSRNTVGVATLQSRAFAGQAGDKFIFCLPGSPGACRDAWDHILGLELDSRHRPCSLAGMIPRLAGVCP